ncbi:hypothetical protein SESBI_28804 [Sesbania bispinosa]|nr:hypothetical protein SESBI_28804 [Sesbania bispinosa]
MESTASPIHGNDGITNKDIRAKARSINDSMKGSAERERGKVTASFENERESVMVRGPTKCLHTTVKRQNDMRDSKMKCASY